MNSSRLRLRDRIDGGRGYGFISEFGERTGDWLRLRRFGSGGLGCEKGFGRGCRGGCKRLRIGGLPGQCRFFFRNFFGFFYCFYVFYDLLHLRRRLHLMRLRRLRERMHFSLLRRRRAGPGGAGKEAESRANSTQSKTEGPAPPRDCLFSHSLSLGGRCSPD